MRAIVRATPFRSPRRADVVTRTASGARRPTRFNRRVSSMSSMSGISG